VQHRSSNTERIAAVEIGRSNLGAVILRRARADEPFTAHTRWMTWRHEGASPATEAGRRELGAALKTFVTEEKLTGAEIGLTLSGDFCVTRVMSGATEDVDRELSELEERSALYLTLGAGPKVCASSVRQLDARHRHALVAVSSRRVLDGVAEAAAAAGLSVATIEPSLVAVSRCLGHMGLDHEQPALIVNLSENGADLGISYQGQVLLDYRPGGIVAAGDVSKIILDHLARLQRYCQRRANLPDHTIQQVFLCGPVADVMTVRFGLEHDGRLIVRELEPTQVEPAWKFADFPTSELCAAAGGCLREIVPQPKRIAPNLARRVRVTQRGALLPALLRAAWPIAAGIAVALATLGLVVFEQLRVDQQEAELLRLGGERSKATQLHTRMEGAQAKLRHLRSVEGALPVRPWHELLETIGHCMPEDIWLENVASQGEMRITVAGASYSDEGIYEFVRWLKQAPGFRDVALEQAQPTSTAGGPAIRFDLNCDLSPRQTGKTQEDRDD
jgi:Tfp pilus assembly protein PilN